MIRLALLRLQHGVQVTTALDGAFAVLRCMRGAMVEAGKAIGAGIAFPDRMPILHVDRIRGADTHAGPAACAAVIQTMEGLG